MNKTGPVSQAKVASSVLGPREKLLKLFASRPIGDEELSVNFGLFMRSGPLARLLFLNEIFQKAINVPGIICEFGVWWGQNLALFENLRAIYEPYNYTRQIVGFDTFTGYPNIGKNDKFSETISTGNYAVPEDYIQYLSEVLDCHEQQNVMAHVKKTELIKGDVIETVPAYFASHPEFNVSLAFFDLALYEPTKRCLEVVRSRILPGSVLAFDEYNNSQYPGETKAVLEVLDINDFKIRRSRFVPDRVYFILK